MKLLYKLKNNANSLCTLPPANPNRVGAHRMDVKSKGKSKPSLNKDATTFTAWVVASIMTSKGKSSRFLKQKNKIL
jgi:hypothetical protein